MPARKKTRRDRNQPKRMYTIDDRFTSALHYYRRPQWRDPESLVAKGKRSIIRLLVIDALLTEQTAGKKRLFSRSVRAALGKLLPPPKTPC